MKNSRNSLSDLINPFSVKLVFPSTLQISDKLHATQAGQFFKDNFFCPWKFVRKFFRLYFEK
jgi:hypothetical protein